MAFLFMSRAGRGRSPLAKQKAQLQVGCLPDSDPRRRNDWPRLKPVVNNSDRRIAACHVRAVVNGTSDVKRLADLPRSSRYEPVR